VTKRLVLPLLALLLTAACTQQEPAAPAADAPAAATAPATGAAATPAAAPATGDVPAVDPAAKAAAQAALDAAASAPAPVEGADYVKIQGGQPFIPDGKIEVVEVFGYTCPHCASFQPLVNAFKSVQPADVRFTYVAAPFGGYWVPYAKAFYAAEQLGVVDRTHDAMFRAIHLERTLPVQPLPTDEQIAAFYGKQGVDAKQFASTMGSFAINGKLSRATQFIQRSGVDSTPTLVVNGKYRITGKSPEDNLRIANQLVAQERAAAAKP
jgi:thiol:disulfide interchange protein DsbA